MTEEGQPTEATTEHRRSIMLAPDSPAPHDNLAMASNRRATCGRLFAEYRKSLALEPDNAEAHGNLAIVLAFRQLTKREAR